MYLRFYSLREGPFGITPDPAFLYLSASHKEAIASLLYGIEKRKGFITITGEVGCGKTTVLRAFLAKINTERVKTIYLFNPELTFSELLTAIFEELGLGDTGGEPASTIRRLHHYLIETYRQGKHVALIVDEAQRMPVETLERLRILSNLETSKDKLLQIVLCGQPEFEEVLSMRVLRQLRERVAVRANIRLLTRGEGLAYLRHRLGRVSYGKAPVFTEAAMRRIVRYARGNPRTMNIACDNALIAGYAVHARPITVGIAREVTSGLGLNKKRAVFRWAATCVAALLVFLSASAAIKTVYGDFSSETAEVVSRRIDGGAQIAEQILPAGIAATSNKKEIGSRETGYMEPTCAAFVPLQPPFTLDLPLPRLCMRQLVHENADPIAPAPERSFSILEMSATNETAGNRVVDIPVGKDK